MIDLPIKSRLYASDEFNWLEKNIVMVFEKFIADLVIAYQHQKCLVLTSNSREHAEIQQLKLQTK